MLFKCGPVARLIMADTRERIRPSTAVVNAIADREGVEVTELEPPLTKVIDPDALDTLFQPTQRGDSAATGEVTFRYNGYLVTVAEDGEVEVADNG